MSALPTFILGTAQLSSAYGITRSVTKIGGNSQQILEAASRIGIRVLDTAPSYEGAFSEIAKFNKSSADAFQIISKWTFDRNKTLKQIFESQLQLLSVDRLVCFLSHNPEDIYRPEIRSYISMFQDELGEELYCRIGFSVYESSDLEGILDLNLQNGLLQVPCNVLNKDILNTDAMKELLMRGFKVHVRSIFLQGILLKEPTISHKGVFYIFDEARRVIKDFAYKSSISPEHLLISYFFNSKSVEGIVLGVEDDNQLSSLHKAWDNPELDFEELELAIEKLAIPRKLLDPRNWPKG